MGTLDDIAVWTGVAILILLALVTIPCGPVILGYPIAALIQSWQVRHRAREQAHRATQGRYRYTPTSG